MKRIMFFLFAVFFFVVSARGAAFAAAEGEPQVSASAAILIEETTGRVVWAKKPEARRFPASMTKMMTAVLALENMRQDSPVAMSETAAGTESSNIGIAPLEQLTMINMVTGMMLVSDNAAAVALAEHMDGSVAAFARRMNEKAKEIGCTDTNFANPNGLPDIHHYSTAADMAKIARYCMQNPVFRDIVSTESTPAYWLIAP